MGRANKCINSGTSRYVLQVWDIPIFRWLYQSSVLYHAVTSYHAFIRATLRTQLSHHARVLRNIPTVIVRCVTSGERHISLRRKIACHSEHTSGAVLPTDAYDDAELNATCWKMPVHSAYSDGLQYNSRFADEAAGPTVTRRKQDSPCRPHSVADHFQRVRGCADGDVRQSELLAVDCNLNT